MCNEVWPFRARLLRSAVPHHARKVAFVPSTAWQIRLVKAYQAGRGKDRQGRWTREAQGVWLPLRGEPPPHLPASAANEPLR